MDTTNYYDMIKFYHDIIYKVLLGIGAAIVTIVGFGFEKHCGFYIFMSCWLMVVSSALFLYAKTHIVFYWICIYRKKPSDELKQYITYFVRCNEKKKKALDTILCADGMNNLSYKDLKKTIRQVVPIRPTYLGTYTILLITTLILIICFIYVMYCSRWAFFQ